MNSLKIRGSTPHSNSNNSIPQNQQKSTQKSKNVDGKDFALPRDMDWDSLEEIFAEAYDTSSEMFDADAVIVKGPLLLNT